MYLAQGPNASLSMASSMNGHTCDAISWPAAGAGLMDLAEAIDGARPSYYGSAWTALANAWLYTDPS